MRVIGLMSGTSLDGIDAALLDIDGSADEPRWSLLAFVSVAYSREQRCAIHDAIAGGSASILCRLHADLGEWFAAAALQACAAGGLSARDVDLIGCHGQTVWHQPPQQGQRGATLQLGCPATIAERTGINVVSDFRARDVAAGGEGAPLVPWVDRLLFSHEHHQRVLQNIGGMANCTWLPRRGDRRPLVAFDTGPGVALMDALVELASGGAETYDRDGHWASEGAADESLLGELLSHPFFEREPPKSTGREAFGRPLAHDLAGRLQPRDRSDWADLVLTVTALTARTIGAAHRRWLLPRGVDEVILTGGGSRNPVLRRLLEQELAPVPVLAGDVLGIDPDAKEAVAFATLAWAHARAVPGNAPEATGAVGPRVLGSFTPGAKRRDAAGG